MRQVSTIGHWPVLNKGHPVSKARIPFKPQVEDIRSLKVSAPLPLHSVFGRQSVSLCSSSSQPIA